MSSERSIAQETARGAVRAARPTLRLVESGARVGAGSTAAAAAEGTGLAARAAGILRGALGPISAALGVLFYPSVAHAPDYESPPSPPNGCSEGCPSSNPRTDAGLEEGVEPHQARHEDQTCSNETLDGLEQDKDEYQAEIESQNETLPQGAFPKNPKKIKKWVSCEMARRRLDLLRQIKAKREEIQLTCYANTDRGHLDAISQLDSAIRNAENAVNLVCE